MSSEFSQNPHEGGETIFKALSTEALWDIAESSESLTELRQIQFIIVERALENEFDDDTNELALKIDTLINDRLAEIMNEEHALIAEQMAVDQAKEAEEQYYRDAWFTIWPYMKQVDSDHPELAAEEDARIALFKQSEQ